MRKYLFGSKLLKLDNARDEDWVIFVEKRGKETKGEERSIPCCNVIINHFISEKNIIKDPYKALGLYQHSAPFFNDENYPFNSFNILNHIEQWKKWLKAYINDKIIEENAIKNQILPKQFYHLLYQYYMIIENTHWISETAKSQVQKIHDLEVPSSYFYELRNLINNMEE